MKLLMGILAIALIFGYIFVQSHAWDVDTRTVDKEGVDVEKGATQFTGTDFFSI